MSLGPVFVLCDDGLYYEDPIFAAAEDGGWFVCFAEDEEPELVVAQPQVAVDAARDLLAHAGFPAINVRAHAQSGRVQLPLSRRQFCLSSAFWLHVPTPPPAKLIFERQDRVLTTRSVAGTYYDYGYFTGRAYA